MAVLDHLVVAASSLDVGVRWLEERLGVSLAAGGKHPAMATHNRLLRLGERLYLELIAIDPEAPAPDRPRWFALDSEDMRRRLAQEPQLIHWVARTDDLARDSAATSESPGEVVSMRRGDYCWRITLPDDGHLPGDGLLPTLIQWDVPFHPADSLPESACALMKLEALHPHATRMHSDLAVLGLERTIDIQLPAVEDKPEMVAYLRCPKGLVELAGAPGAALKW